MQGDAIVLAIIYIAPYASGFAFPQQSCNEIGEFHRLRLRPPFAPRAIATALRLRPCRAQHRTVAGQALLAKWRGLFFVRNGDVVETARER